MRTMRETITSGKKISFSRISDLFLSREREMEFTSRILNISPGNPRLLRMIPGTPISFFILQGDSMQPAYQDGDLIVAEPARDVKIGEVIVFQEPCHNKIIIHRVIHQDSLGYITHGDANSGPDLYPVPYDATQGKVWIRIPKIGHVIQFIQRWR